MQLRLAERRGAGEIPDVLILIEHPRTYTRGRRTKPEELPMGNAWYEERGIEIIDSDRGGLVTYHGPGQLVAYPIVDLAPLGGDVHEFVRGLERVMIGALGEHGVPAQAIEGWTGVWTEGSAPAPGLADAARKIGFIGLHVSRGITTHGLSINVDVDLAPFEWVVPCGITDAAMTSIALETGGPETVAAVGDTVARHFGTVFGRDPKATTAAELGLEAAPSMLKGER
ncbi:MAG: lipoyl(octanoyl) transferase LipB [Actinobacteria bacterium]|nr:lipoyl(octanoyl) transferase LipB [Actinomycetota bacterium]OJU83686.1 MAG: lipoyl(octanoyl) transferase [Solirubrobacterales bacterium 70-9]